MDCLLVVGSSHPILPASQRNNSQAPWFSRAFVLGTLLGRRLSLLKKLASPSPDRVSEEPADNRE